MLKSSLIELKGEYFTNCSSYSLSLLLDTDLTDCGCSGSSLFLASLNRLSLSRVLKVIFSTRWAGFYESSVSYSFTSSYSFECKTERAFWDALSDFAILRELSFWL